MRRDFVHVELLRFDSPITADDYLAFLLNSKAQPMPSVARTTGFEFQ